MIYTVITIGTTEPIDEFTDQRGLLDRVEFDPATIPDGLPRYPPAPDLIYIREDWPPIGSPDFAEQLRNWHAQNNPDKTP